MWPVPQFSVSRGNLIQPAEFPAGENVACPPVFKKLDCWPFHHENMKFGISIAISWNMKHRL